MSTSKSRKHAYLLLTIVSLIWGIATPVVKFTLSEIDPLPFLVYRFSISTIIGLIFIYKSKRHLAKIVENFPIVVLYSFITTTFALGILFWGIDETTAIQSALISSVAPLVTAFAGYVFLKEHITKREKFGMLVALVGTLFTVSEPLLSGNDPATSFRGNLLVFSYIVIMASSSIYSKKLTRKNIDPLTLTNVSFVIGLVAFLPLLFVGSNAPNVVSQISRLSFSHHVGIWYMALFSGTLAYALWVRGQKTIEISEAGVFAYLVPLFAAPVSVLWLKETISTPFILGAIIIGIGVFVAEKKK